LDELQGVLELFVLAIGDEVQCSAGIDWLFTFCSRC